MRITPFSFASRARAAIPLFLAAALALACSRFPLGGAPIPGPATVAAEITQTFEAGQGQGLDETPIPASTATATVASASTRRIRVRRFLTSLLAGTKPRTFASGGCASSLRASGAAGTSCGAASTSSTFPISR